MDQLVNRPRTATAPLRPLTGPLPPQTGPLPQVSRSGELAAEEAAISMAAAAAVGRLGLDVAAKPLAEIEVPARPGAPVPPKAPSFVDRAGDVLAKALANKAKLVESAAAVVADRTFLNKVRPIFSQMGNAALARLAAAGKLSAIDDNLQTMRDVIADQLRHGANPRVLEIISNQALHPDSIEQMAGKETCPTATFQKALAEGNPGAYAKAAYDLLIKGKASLPDGTELSLSPENKKWVLQQQLPTAKRINALFQVALAEAVVKPDRYDVATDTVTKTEAPEGDGPQGGVAALEAAEPVEGGQAKSKFGGPFSKLGELGKKVLKGHGKKQETGGLDFYKVVTFYRMQGTPILDPRGFRHADDNKRWEGLEKAFHKGAKKGQSLSLPVHSEGGRSKYHMVQVTGIDAKGNVSWFDPESGQQKAVPKGEFMKMVGWDIKGYHRVGGGRVIKSGGGTGSGGGTV